MESEGRRAAHVKWDGKTIALGTFPVAEAVEKCERAKALTKKWRASMIPKPDVEWVKRALERLNIRVVNDRPGRRRKGEIVQDKLLGRKMSCSSTDLGGGAGVQVSLPLSIPNAPSCPQISGTRSPPHHEFSKVFYSQSYSSNEQPEEITIGSYGIQDNSAAMGDTHTGTSNFPTPSYSKDPYETTDSMPSGFPSNAEATSRFSEMGRNDYYHRIATSFSGRSNPPGMDSAAASRHHYEILKEHHANLLRELQQTTDMMQMYQKNYQQIEQESLDAMSNSVYAAAAPSVFHTSQQKPHMSFRPQSHSGGLGEPMYYPYDFPMERSTLRTAQPPFSQRSHFDRINDRGLHPYHDRSTNSTMQTHNRGDYNMQRRTMPSSNENISAHNISTIDSDTNIQAKRLKYGSFVEQDYLPNTRLNPKFDKTNREGV